MADPDADGRALAALRAVVVRLRDPETGCPWDRERTLDNVFPSLADEVEELREAMERADPAHVREELGDVLFNALMIARLAEEAGWFTWPDMLSAVTEKIVRRHPHVFGDVKADTPEAAMSAYLAAKALERKE